MRTLEEMLKGLLYAGQNQYQQERQNPWQQQKRSRMLAAGLAVDLGNTLIGGASITGQGGGAGVAPPTIFGSGSAICVASGTTIGQTIDLINAHVTTHVIAQGFSASGQLRLQVQTSDSDTSGNFTDPTSGLQTLPSVFQSGGIIWLNSGGGATCGLFGAFVSGQAMNSGFGVQAYFQRPNRFARVNVLSEGSSQYAGPLVVCLFGQNHETGSGGGFTFNPGSGSVAV